MNDTLTKIRDGSCDRKVFGEAVGLLPCAKQFEFVLEIDFFARLLSPLDDLTKALQGPDPTFKTVIVLRDAAVKYVDEQYSELIWIQSLPVLRNSQETMILQLNLQIEENEKHLATWTALLMKSFCHRLMN